MTSEDMDRHAWLSMNSSVIANEVTQSMSPDCMDCRATLAVTKSLFKGRVRYRAGYGGLAVTMSLFKARVRYRTRYGGLAMTVLFHDLGHCYGFMQVRGKPCNSTMAQFNRLQPMTIQPGAPLPNAFATSKDALQTVSPIVALGWLHTAKFLTTAPQLHFLPPLQVPEIAFVGRSNAGKSTCINTLTQQKQLAFASKKPGRTQHINLFSLGKQGVTDAVLADLPGYGYAAVPKQDKIRWQQVMANYLVTRENLKAIVLMCDPRHGLTELDEVLLDVVRPRVEEGLKFLVILTKADKLTRAEQSKALSIMQLQAGGGEVRLFSATKRQGVEEVATLLWQWAHPAPPQPSEAGN